MSAIFNSLMSITNLSIEQLKQIISIKEEIAALEQNLTTILGGELPASVVTNQVTSTPAKRGRKKMSPEHKAKLIAASKARWAKFRGTAPAAVKAPPAAKAVKGKRVLSPEGRARIVAALKARWAKKAK